MSNDNDGGEEAITCWQQVQRPDLAPGAAIPRGRGSEIIPRDISSIAIVHGAGRVAVQFTHHFARINQRDRTTLHHAVPVIVSAAYQTIPSTFEQRHRYLRVVRHSHPQSIEIEIGKGAVERDLREVRRRDGQTKQIAVIVAKDDMDRTGKSFA